MDDLVSLQIAKALYNLENDRPIFKEYKDLPAVGTKYCLVEAGEVIPEGISEYGKEIYYNAIEENYKEDVVMSQSQTFTITAASNKPSIFLQKLTLKRHTEDFWYTFFSNEGIGVNTLGNIRDTSVPTDGGDWEARRSITLTVNFLTKETTVVNTIEAIDFAWGVVGGSDGTGSVEL